MKDSISAKQCPGMHVSIRLRMLFAFAIFTFAIFALFGVQATASADDGSTNGSFPSIDWSLTDPNFSILNSSALSSGSSEDGSSDKNDASLSVQRVGQRPMYRLYNKWSGEHFYTCEETERDGLVKIGWTSESIGWVAPKTSSAPVYRLYNKYVAGGDHHYTLSKTERDGLVKEGWTYEGVGWYSADEGSLYRAPVYRQYNPYQYSCNHNYTLDTKEKNMLIKAGWNDEGVAYYGLDQTQMSPISFDGDDDDDGGSGGGGIKVTTTSKVYNGKPQTQTITSKNLKLNEDYIVTYSNNTNVGTATITISGINGFYGEKKYTFQITQKPVTVKWGTTDFTYDGKAHIPTATAVGLCGTDKATVTVTASGDHTKTGTYTATATAISNKNYKLSGTLKTNFTIGTPIDYEKKNVVTVDLSDEIYTGKAITKDVSVSGLTKDKDYSVAFANNVNAGTATITIKGINQYSGTKSYTFKINKRALTVDWTNTKLTYNAEKQKPTATISSGKQGSDTITTTVHGEQINANASGETYNATVSLDEKSQKNYEIENGGSTTFTISPLDISSATITLGSTLTYNGTYQLQSVESVKVGDLTIPASDYEVTRNKQKNAGTYTGSKSLMVSPATSNITGTPKVEWSIAKADPKYTPATLTGELGYQLSSVTLPDPASGDTSGTATWNDGTATMSTKGTQTFNATFTPTDTTNYNTLTNIKVTVDVKKTGFKVNFVTNAPSGVTATIDGKTASEVTKHLIFDDESSEVEQHTLANADFPTIVNTTSGSTWQFAGWSTNSEDTVKSGIAQDQIVSNKTQVTEDTTYYAIWLNSSGYWIGTKGANENYENDAYFATHDENYLSASAIEADMEALHGDSATTAYYNAKAKWDKYYSDDKVRLYATYEGGENEGSYDSSSTTHDKGTTSKLNKYVEFRILEVSGTNGHKYDGVNSDNSVVTFMATHMLPTAYQMKSSSDNSGGWESSTLMTQMNKEKIYEKFASTFTNKVKSVYKSYSIGGGAETIGSDRYKFWVLSSSELTGSSLGADEGAQYKWCSDKKIQYTNESNTAIKGFKTRAGDVPGCAGSNDAFWWERTPSATTAFLMVDSAGKLSGGYAAPYAWGVVPSFCF